MILFFDTETTGLPDWRSPSTADHQPRLVQLAYLLCDEEGAEIMRCSVIVRPDGWTIPKEVSAIHGITTEIATQRGLPAAEIIDAYLDARRKAKLRVAHNVSFDDRIMRIAKLRHGLDRDAVEAMEAAPKFCTMHATTPILNLPPTERMQSAGFNKPKPPKLAECIRFFFDEDLAGAHDAMIDVEACRRIFFHLRP